MIHYFVNSKRRSVIAVLKDTAHDEVNSLYRKMGYGDLPWDVEKAAVMPDSFRVEVVCSPEDEFDVEVGKRLAKKRILDNYDRSRKKARGRAERAWNAYVSRVDRAM